MSLARKIITTLALTGLALGLLAAPKKGYKKKAAPQKTAEFPYQVIEFTLENGLKVLLVPRRDIPAVTYWTYFKVGSRNERPGITGIAHYFEHMMFNGGKKYGPGEFDKLLEAAGGYSNAYTSNDITAYYENFGPSGLDVVLDLELDRMESLAFDPTVMESERKVVMSERRLRTDNSIYGMLFEDLDAAAFKAHPYGWPVVGWMADLENIKRQDCLDFFDTYYAPNNAVMILIGDFDPKATEEKIRSMFGILKSGPPPREVNRSEPEQKGERRLVIEYPAQNETFLVGWHVPEVTHPDMPALEILSSVLSGGQSSRLVKRMQVQETMANVVEAYYDTRIDPTLFAALVGMVPGRSAKDGEAALYSEIEKLVATGVLDSELTKAKNKIKTRTYAEMMTNVGIGRVMGQAEIFFGDWRQTFGVLKAYEAVTGDDVVRVAKTYLVQRNRTVATLIPTTPEKEEAAQ